MNIERDLYKLLLDGLYDGVYFMDRDRVIPYGNHGAEQITGFSMEDVIGTACRDNILIHVDEQGRRLCQSDLCPAMKTILDGHDREAEVFLYHKEGHRLPVLVRISPIRKPDGDIIGAAEVFTDNRQMHAAREKIEELKKQGSPELTTLLKQADTALDNAKKKGRNRAEVFLEQSSA